ncbi:uncharacterized protein LOC126884759 [Diabrotica virgifera virgifera]|uniref:Uncharacterized protein n=1 Tax=Diabrotica virgifera virgifera TaxID=50390 RepID=A0ABM5K9S0_DIAVI|nr:uncharacterized protein LOC126884759 [Diabrotica virgifera virgifera]
MDNISEQLKLMAENKVEQERRAKLITQLSGKKYDLQKSLKETESEIDLKQCELEKVKKEVITLSCELPLWQEKEKVARECFRDLVRQVVEMDDKVTSVQTDLWTSINEWITSSSQQLKKNVLAGNSTKSNSPELEERIKHERIEQIKLEGQLEAVKAYEKFLYRKVDEILRIKDIIDDVDNRCSI